MCLTIPRKVVSFSNRKAIIENNDGTRQDVRSLIELEPGDFVMVQGDMVVEKMDPQIAKETLSLLNSYQRKEVSHESD